MPVIMKKFSYIFNHPTTRLFNGIILLLTGLLEFGESTFEEMLHWDIGIHHGIIVFAITKVFGSLAEIFEGGAKVSKLE